MNRVWWIALVQCCQECWKERRDTSSTSRQMLVERWTNTKKLKTGPLWTIQLTFYSGFLSINWLEVLLWVPFHRKLLSIILLGSHLKESVVWCITTCDWKSHTYWITVNHLVAKSHHKLSFNSRALCTMNIIFCLQVDDSFAREEKTSHVLVFASISSKTFLVIYFQPRFSLAH